jgi:hypothetical protein
VFTLLQTPPHQHLCTHISLYHPSLYLTHTLSHTSLLIYSELLSLTRRLLLIMPNKSLSLSPSALGLPGSSYPFFFLFPLSFSLLQLLISLSVFSPYPLNHQFPQLIAAHCSFASLIYPISYLNPSVPDAPTTTQCESFLFCFYAFLLCFPVDLWCFVSETHFSGRRFDWLRSSSNFFFFVFCF